MCASIVKDHTHSKRYGIKMDYAKQIAEAGLKIGAIKVQPEQPFLWASGHRMPIYNDNRLFLFYPEYRSLIAAGLEALMEGIKAEVIASAATAGIAPGYGLADRLRLPFIYVRNKPKNHGRLNIVEGTESLNGERVVVIEDLISFGGSAAKVIEAVRGIGGQVEDCISIFSYGLKESQALFEKINCKVHSILTYSFLLKVALEEGYFSREQLDMLKDWQSEPKKWWEKWEK